VVHHCRHSSVLSLFSALLDLFWCACVSSYSILVQFYKVDCDFSTHDVHKKDRKEEKIKKVDVTFFLVPSEPRPGPSSTKQKEI
jgi:predicted ATP-grasp superfamily ATP-dependent carboligase